MNTKAKSEMMTSNQGLLLNMLLRDQLTLQCNVLECITRNYDYYIVHSTLYSQTYIPGLSIPGTLIYQVSSLPPSF